MNNSTDAGSVRHGVDPTSVSKFVACFAFSGLGAFLNDSMLIGLGASVYLGWVGANLFRVSPSRRLSIRILLTWVGVLLTGVLNTSESLTRFATDPLEALRFCVASWVTCIVVLAVVETCELFLVMGYCWIRDSLRSKRLSE